LTEAIQEYLYDILISSYKHLRAHKPLEDKDGNGECYKWETITYCQGKTIEEIVNKIAQTNLLYYSNNSVVKWLLTNKKDEYLQAVAELINEGNGCSPLLERMENYRSRAIALTKDNEKAKSSRAEDDRTMAALLACKYPDKYTFYMDTLYQNLCEYLGIKAKTGVGYKYEDYLRLLQPLVVRIHSDGEIYKDLNVFLEGLLHCDLLLAQDICWEFFYMNTSWLPYSFFGKENVWLWNGDEHTFEQNFLAIGSNAPTLDFKACTTQSQMRKAYQKILGNKDTSVPDAYWKFTQKAKEKDYVVVFRAIQDPLSKKYNHQLLGYGRFSSKSYESNKEMENPIRRAVVWEKQLEESVIDDMMHGSLFFQSVDEKKKVENIKRLLGIIKTSEKMESPLVTQYKNFLQNNHNMIFTGAPGTGKTYLAKQIAASIIGCSVEELRENKHFGFVQFHPSYDYTDFVEGLRPSEEEGKEFELRQGIFKQFCATALEKNTSFDEAYSRLLEDVQALDKPMAVITPTGASFGITLNSNGNLNLHTGEKIQKNGVLTAEALKAMANNQPTYPYWQGYYKGVVELLKQKYGLQVSEEDEKSDYVFVIDEINRGEISKIFGELFYSIDPGYRGEVGSVKTQYQNMVKDGPFTNGFYVPKNVYIIGTMNDIDRSVESLDFAFRRRFPSVEIGYEDTLDSICEQLNDKNIIEEAKEHLRHLNDQILKDESLGAEYCIGGSYLLKLNEIQNSFENLWKYYIQPVVAEYFRGLPSVEKAEKLSTLRNAFLGEYDK